MVGQVQDPRSYISHRLERILDCRTYRRPLGGPGLGLRAGEDRIWGGGVLCNLWGSPVVDLREVVALR